MTTAELGLLLVVWVACGFAAYAIAARRGRDTTGAFLTGAVLGPLGVLLVLIQKPSEPVRWDR